MRGGSGNTGRYRHKRSRLIRNKEFVHMHYVGKKGFRSVAEKRHIGTALKTLNLWQLSDIVDKLVEANKAQMENQKVVLDLREMGYKKLLGLGSISRAIQVKVDYCSESALKKVKDAGGDAVLSTPPE